MSRWATLFWCFSILSAGTFLFQVKYEVIQLETQLDQIKRQIIQDRQTIHLLKAEWGHLTDPTRLSRLSEQYLKFIPVRPTQMAGIRSFTNILNNYVATANRQPTAEISSLSRTSAFSNQLLPVQPAHFQAPSPQQSHPR